MSKTKSMETLVTTPASFRHDNILAMVILGILCCFHYDDQSVVVTSFTTGLHHHHYHHHHRADSGVVTKVSPVPTLLSSPSTATATAPLTTRTRTGSLQGFFGGMFGEAKDDQNPDDDKKEKVLAEYNVGTNKDDVDVQFASLSDYLINQWAPLFLTGTIKLTTAVELVKLPSDTDSNNVNGNVAGCQLLFKKSETGYVSKSEEGEGAYAPTSTTTMEATTTTGSYQPPPSTDNNNNNNNTNGGDAKKTTTTTKKKKEEKKQGGVEIQVVVEKLASASASASSYSLLQVRAKRCEVDEDTMIKEMSEEVIIQELKKAIGVWKKKSA